MCSTATSDNISEKIYKYIELVRSTTFSESPYVDIVSTKLNAGGSAAIVFCGLKAFDCTSKKRQIVFCFKNDYFEKFNEADIPVDYEIKNIKSLKDYTRVYISNNFIDLKKFVDYIFVYCETYVDTHYIPDHIYDCCHRYMECSDTKHCTCPDYLYSKGCTYRKKLEKGIIFFGNNRNIE